MATAKRPVVLRSSALRAGSDAFFGVVSKHGEEGALFAMKRALQIGRAFATLRQAFMMMVRMKRWVLFFLILLVSIVALLVT
jgi:hypothetical protein